MTTSQTPTSEFDSRRRALLQKLAAGASLAAAAGSPVLAQNAPAAARAPEPEPDETTAKFIGLMSELSNWNRWGPDDQLGTLNLITPAKTKAALALVREGVTVSMERDLDLVKSVDNTTPPVLEMLRAGQGQEIGKFKTGGTSSMLHLTYHNFVQTHMNALCHFLYDGKMYNGHSQELVTKESGAIKNSIMSFKSGVVTRAVLLDMCRHKGKEWLEPGEVIYPADLEACEKRTGVKVASGDVFLVRTGRTLRRQKLGPWPISEGVAGIHMDCAKWMHDRGVALVGGDGDQDVRPSRVTGIGAPIHTLCHVAMGMSVIDEMDLELVSQEAAKRNRWAFCMMAAPLRIPGGTSSVINPLALF
jgi:kynurenine formamidase